MKDERIVELEKQIDDFDLKAPTYQVWLFRYDQDDNIIDDEYIGESTDYKIAENRANELAENADELAQYFNEDTAYVGIEVEEVVQVDNGWEENQGSLYIVNKINPNYEIK